MFYNFKHAITSNASWPISSEKSVQRVASTLTFDLGGRHCLEIRPLLDNTNGKDSGVYSAKGLLYSHNHDPYLF